MNRRITTWITVGNCLLVGYLLWQVYSLKLEKRATPPPVQTPKPSEETLARQLAILQSSQSPHELLQAATDLSQATTVADTEKVAAIWKSRDWGKIGTPLEQAAIECQLLYLLVSGPRVSPDVLMEIEKRAGNPQLPIWKRDSHLRALLLACIRSAAPNESTFSPDVPLQRAIAAAMESGSLTLQMTVAEFAPGILPSFPGAVNHATFVASLKKIWSDPAAPDWARLTAFRTNSSLQPQIPPQDLAMVFKSPSSQALRLQALRCLLAAQPTSPDAVLDFASLDDPALIQESVTLGGQQLLHP